jgi:outer membrane receptor protein involved in Fe transport
MQAEWLARDGLKVRAAAGRYQQFPDFDKVLGTSAGKNLVPEQADQFDAGVEQRLSPSLRFSATVYDREDRGMLRQFGNETRVVDGRVVRRNASSVYENRLDGFARGVELSLQRTVTGAGISGWVSYAYSRNRYHDVTSGETFWGDNDQRHTLNAFAVYRHSDRLSLVGKLRYGSNFPIPGYYAKVGEPGIYLLSDVRNTTRLPAYARLDLRANRTFDWSRRRLTVFAEVINLLNRENVRFSPPLISIATRSVSQPYESMLPIIPSVGILIEF